MRSDYEQGSHDSPYIAHLIQYYNTVHRDKDWLGLNAKVLTRYYTAFRVTQGQ